MLRRSLPAAGLPIGPLNDRGASRLICPGAPGVRGVTAEHGSREAEIDVSASGAGRKTAGMLAGP